MNLSIYVSFSLSLYLAPSLSRSLALSLSLALPSSHLGGLATTTELFIHVNIYKKKTSRQQWQNRSSYQSIVFAMENVTIAHWHNFGLCLSLKQYSRIITASKYSAESPRIPSIGHILYCHDKAYGGVLFDVVVVALHRHTSRRIELLSNFNILYRCTGDPMHRPNRTLPNLSTVSHSKNNNDMPLEHHHAKHTAHSIKCMATYLI